MKLSEAQKAKLKTNNTTLEKKETELKKLEAEIEERNTNKLKLLDEIRGLSEEIKKTDPKEIEIDNLELQIQKLKGVLTVEESEDNLIEEGLGKIKMTS